MGRARNLTGAVVTVSDRLADRFDGVFGPRRSPSTRTEKERLTGLMVTVHIENVYEDGHSSERDVELTTPSPINEGWWEDAVWPETGDGHVSEDAAAQGSYYTATIIRSDNPELLGQSREWL
jgi:hypothetical protein